MKMKNRILIRTELGPVPYEALKEHLPESVVAMVDANMDGILAMVDANMRAELGADYYVVKLAEKKGWEPEKMGKYIDNLTKFNPAAAAMVLLKEVAIDFDDAHEGHIEDSEEIWTISMLNGKVEQVDKTKVKNYRNFPAFRSKKEAVVAHEILSKRLRKMFRGCGKQED
jgi:hypothetical protein